MTDKEQIIINGKGCRYKTWDAECSLTGDHYGDNMQPCKFIDEKSCYFKQLTRKTQECEEQENKIKKLRKNLALEIELNTRYRKALDEIEKILKDEICEECPGKEGCKAGCKEHQCLDIINKVKENEND